jgi:16S rRNA (guanine(966)-N(2))-methyltransferase RsmD
MRVIAGRAKGHKLKTVPGNVTRPITDRVKENLFNILGDRVIDTCWLDLFAGTGQVGIEALSRGAAESLFVDLSWAAIRIVEDNLRHTRLRESARVLRKDAFAYLRDTLDQPFDVIYVAPPQYKGMWLEVLLMLDANPEQYLREDGIVIVQIDPQEYQASALNRLVLSDQRRYGRTMLCFYVVEAIEI